MTTLLLSFSLDLASFAGTGLTSGYFCHVAGSRHLFARVGLITMRVEFWFCLTSMSGHFKVSSSIFLSLTKLPSVYFWTPCSFIVSRPACWEGEVGAWFGGLVFIPPDRRVGGVYWIEFSVRPSVRRAVRPSVSSGSIFLSLQAFLMKLGTHI